MSDTFSFKWGAITLLDFLGWKGVWMNDYKKSSQNNNPVAPPIKTSLSALTELLKKIKDLCDKKNLTFVSVSDTIAIFSCSAEKDDDDKNYKELNKHAEVCNEILDISAKDGFPLRGAITIGEYTHEGNVFMGPGIDECASWYEESDWLGVIFAPSAQFVIDKHCQIGKNQDEKQAIAWRDGVIVYYSHIPLKKGLSGIKYCVAWGEEETILNEVLKNTVSLSKEIAVKYMNTNKYLYSLRPEEKQPEKKTRIIRFKAPLYVQFELTEQCNNKCYFCYNPLGRIRGEELNTHEVKDILLQLRKAGVFRINFNGGEPLMRSDFLAIAEYAYSLEFELHMNTNSTLITHEYAKKISRFMKSICTSILSSDEQKHDRMTGRNGAYQDVLRGIDIWRENGVDVEVNVCTSAENYRDIYNIGKLIDEHDCYALCATRYILNAPENKHLLLNRPQTEELIDLLMKVKNDFPSIRDVSLPGPVPYCEIGEEYYEKLRQLNIPCQYGYGLARISPVGVVTPCTISDDEMGNLRASSFSEIWSSNAWDKYIYMSHIPDSCKSCDELSRCRGGCVVYDQSMIKAGISPNTRKWEKS